MGSDILLPLFVQTIFIDDVFHVGFQFIHRIIRQFATGQHSGDHEL